TFSVGNGVSDPTMTFTGTLAKINAALDGLKFRPNPNYNGAAAIDITVDDQGNTRAGGAQSASTSVALTINPVNDRPKVFSSGGTLSYTEDDGAVIFDGGIVVDDIDNANLAGATIRILSYVAGQDLLGFVDQAGITGNWNPSTGVLTLSGSATLADYQA